MGRDKGNLHAGGGTLIERIVDRLSPGVGEVIIAGGDPPRIAGIHHVADTRPGAGPLAGISAGLTATSSELAWVVACDLPDVEPAVGDLLFASFPQGEGEGGGDVDAVVPRLDGRVEGLCAVYRRTLAARIVALIDTGERRVTALLDQIRVRYIGADELRRVDPELRSFRNLNTPAEYQAWLSSLS